MLEVTTVAYNSQYSQYLLKNVTNAQTLKKITGSNAELVLYVYIYTYTHTYKHTHTRTHTHTHTHAYIHTMSHIHIYEPR